MRFVFKFYFQRMLVFPFFTLTYVPLDEQIPFYRKQIYPSFNKTGKLQVFAMEIFKC